MYNWHPAHLNICIQLNSINSPSVVRFCLQLRPHPVILRSICVFEIHKSQFAVAYWDHFPFITIQLPHSKKPSFCILFIDFLPLQHIKASSINLEKEQYLSSSLEVTRWRICVACLWYSSWACTRAESWLTCSIWRLTWKHILGHIITHQ